MTFKEVEENPQSIIEVECVRGYAKKYKKGDIKRRCDIPDFMGKNWMIAFKDDRYPTPTKQT